MPQKIIYFTDGEKWREAGILEEVKKISQSIALVLVSSRDTKKPNIDHRNEEFLGNSNHLDFFEDELIPIVEKQFERGFTEADRVLLGVSFGGLNAAYFSAHSSAFQNYALLSPITYPNPHLLNEIVFSQRTDLNIFLSSGKNDAENYLKSLEAIYQNKGFRVQTYYSQGGHDFNNWRNQLEAIWTFFVQ